MTISSTPPDTTKTEQRQPRYFGPDPDTSRLRATVLSIGKEIEGIPGHTRVEGTPPTPLVRAYGELVKALALGPEPETRSCPSCGTIGMYGATICGNCWTALTPPARTAAR